jgi:hypothetical protein
MKTALPFQIFYKHELLLNTVLLLSSIHIPMKDRYTRNILVLGYRHHTSPSDYMDLAA